MPFDIATGTYTDADAVQPLQTSGSGIDAVGGVTPRTPVASGPADSGPLQGGVMDTVGMLAADTAAGVADARAAMQTAMSARDAALAHYGAQALPLGGAIGDQVDLPPVPENAVPPSDSFLMPYSGDEPTPALDFYGA